MRSNKRRASRARHPRCREVHVHPCCRLTPERLNQTTEGLNPILPPLGRRSIGPTCYRDNGLEWKTEQKKALSKLFNWANGSSDTRENPAKNSTRPAFGYHRHHRHHHSINFVNDPSGSPTAALYTLNADIHVHTFDTFQSHAPPCATTATVTALEHIFQGTSCGGRTRTSWESTELSHGTTSGIGFSNFHPERRTCAHKQGIR